MIRLICNSRWLAAVLSLVAIALIAPTASAQVAIKFRNKTSGKVLMNWLDPNNNNTERNLGELDPNSEGQTVTGVGQTWIARDAAGRQLKRFVVTAAATIDITEPEPIVGTRLFRVQAGAKSPQLKLAAPGIPAVGADSLVFASQVRTKGQGADGLLATPYSLVFNTPTQPGGVASWSVTARDGVQAGCEFDVLLATSDIAFRHREAVGNALISYFDNSLCNGNDEVILFVNRVQALNAGAASHPLGIHWDDATKRWGVVYTDGARIEQNAQFNVLVLSVDADSVLGQKAMVSDWTNVEDAPKVNQPAGTRKLVFPGTENDFVFSTFDAAPAGMALDDAVPNRHDPLLTRANGTWHISNADGQDMPGKSRFVMLFVTGAGAGPTPAPIGGGRTVRLTNTSKKVVVVSIAGSPPISDFLEPGETRDFPNVADGAVVQLTGSANDPVASGQVNGADLTLSFPAANPLPPVPNGYTLQVINHTRAAAAVSVMPPNDTQWRAVGVVAPNGGSRFPNLADGTRIQVTGGPFSVSRNLIRGADLKMDFGKITPDPAPTTYTVTVVNRGNKLATVAALPLGQANFKANYKEIGTVGGGETKAFGNLADGTLIRVYGPFSATGASITGADRTIEFDDPAPAPQAKYKLTVVNRGRGSATVSVMLPLDPGAPGPNDYQVVGTVAGGETKSLGNFPDGSRVQVAGRFSLTRRQINGADLTLDFGGNPDPQPQNYTLTVVNLTTQPATVSVMPPGAVDFQAIGFVAKGETKAFANQPNGTRIQVVGFAARTAGTINGADRTINFGSPDPLPPVPPPVPPVGGGYRVTVTLDRLDVVNGGDGPADPGDLYWKVQVVERTPMGPIARMVSQRDRRNSVEASSGRSYNWNRLDPNGGSVSFDAAAGTPIDVVGAFDEYDDFLRGGDDHLGDFGENLRVPQNGQPGQQTFRQRMLENVPNGGDITLTYTVRFEPK